MFLTDERNKEFFERLEELVAQYGELELFGDVSEDPDFDPASPRILEGIVLILSHRNMQGVSSLTCIDKLHQNRFFTMGMLQGALDVA